MMRAGDLGKVRWPDGGACATTFLPVGQRFAGKRSVHRRTARVPLDRTASSGHICASITLPGNRFAPIRTLPPKHTPPRRSSGRLPVSGIGSRSSILIGIAPTAFRWNLPPAFLHCSAATLVACRGRRSSHDQSTQRDRSRLQGAALSDCRASRPPQPVGGPVLCAFSGTACLRPSKPNTPSRKNSSPRPNCRGGQPNRPPPFLLALRARRWRRSTNRYVVKPDDDFATRLKAVRQFGIRRPIQVLGFVEFGRHIGAMKTDLDKAREIIRKHVRFIERTGITHENIAIAVAEGIALGRKEGIAMAAEAITRLKSGSGR
jgi:hypothetical protein